MIHTPTRSLLLLFTVLFLIALLLAACELPAESDETTSDNAPSGETAVVTWVIDGDTVDATLNGETVRIRYISVNSPERDEPCYDDATKANIALVKGKTVTLVKDVSNTDDYGRLLRYIYVGDTFVNAELVRQGYAEANRYPPDTTQYDYLEGLETEARNAGRGCHPTGVFR